MPRKGVTVSAVLDISATVPKETLREFHRAFGRYRDELGNSQRVAVRRGTVALIRGLRARTAKSKKMAPLRDVKKYEGPGPKYITPKGKNQKPQRRWEIRRHAGKDERRYVYAAESRADARRTHGKYTRWGLAKHSWGWFMKALFKRAEQTGGNPATRIDPRMTEGYLREVVTGTNPRVEVLIVNKLDYINDALPASALSAAMSAATRYIDGQIDKGLARARKELA